ncbi:hypothetical protein MYCTH_95125 [Thermothelomyces thermophilus ATCC 42464]|uniref:Uncharacterized protein n=1 Tax=Thermothelomyces thermophilus (strain ATCC 42464 / BCRC 31852 / DSM 1799) TaxID=573729 RepID=G2QHC6_THET4|nr:uncharacterized protein MYCTH_95125 [Thermothelomyces thermophilus ATCC 42464]AEO58786.1 hypothetical protein MYCTH_95125 [Thermothelomyces thermophilus ATCC 42464]
MAQVWPGLEFVLVNPLTHQEETKTPRRSNWSLYRAAWPVRTVLLSSTNAQSTTPGLLFTGFKSLQGQCSRNSDLFFPYALPFTSSHFHHHVFPILFFICLWFWTSSSTRTWKNFDLVASCCGGVAASYKHVCTVQGCRSKWGVATDSRAVVPDPPPLAVSHPASLPPSLPSPLPPSEESRASPGWGFGECFSKPSESGMVISGYLGKSPLPAPGTRAPSAHPAMANRGSLGRARGGPGGGKGGGALASADAGTEKGTDSLRCIPTQPLQQREPNGTDISELVDQWLRNSGRRQVGSGSRFVRGPGRLQSSTRSRRCNKKKKFAPSIQDCHDPSPGIVALRIIPAIEMEGGQMRAEPTVSYSDTVMIM